MYPNQSHPEFTEPESKITIEEFEEWQNPEIGENIGLETALMLTYLKRTWITQSQGFPEESCYE